jgi:homoserine kinase
MSSVRVFAPATVANLGPGFDVIGMAISGLGDTVAATRIQGPPGVELGDLTGDGGQLPREVGRNTATVAANSVAQRLGIRLRIDLEKGLPLCSGLGSSAASAVAGAVAAAIAGGLDLATARRTLLNDALAGEAVASGAAHADNAAPCLLGGCVLIHCAEVESPGVVELPVPSDLWIALAIPDIEVPTREARAALPRSIALSRAVVNWGRLGGLVAGFYRNDLEMIGRCLHDDIVEPVRGGFITAFSEVKAAATDAGALACSISGAGPTVFGFADSESAARSVADAMQRAWSKSGVESRTHVAQPDLAGARLAR